MSTRSARCSERDSTLWNPFVIVKLSKKMKSKYAEYIGGILVLIILIFFAVFYSKTSMRHGRDDWKKYNDTNIGIEFEHPGDLTPIYEKSVYFSDCKWCPGIINVRADDVGGMSLEEAFQNFSASGDLIGEMKIDDIRAFVTVPTSEGKRVTDNKRIYLVRDGLLYTIAVRSLLREEDERFFKSIRFIPTK